MAAACDTRLLHPCPGRAVAIGSQLLIRHRFILQLTSISRGRSTIRHM